MSSRFTRRKSSSNNNRSDENGHLLFDPDNDKTRKITSTAGNSGGITLTLFFKRLLLQLLSKRDALFRSSVFVFASVLLVSQRLKPTTSVTMSTSIRGMARSIPHQAWSRFYSTAHPVTIRFDHLLENIPRQVRLEQNHTIRKVKEWTEEDEQRQQDLWNEEEYEEDEVAVVESYKDMPECKPMHKWQTSQYPTCTVIHEQRLIDNELGKFLARGFFRQTFEIYDQQTDNPVAMKTIRSKKKFFTPYHMDKHRVDALIYERTSASPWITDIYGFCGLSGLFEFAGGGNMEVVIFDEVDKKRKSLSRIEKLALAVEAASAIADLHSIDSINGYSAMIHGDIYLNQFVLIGNRFKLNDFNRGHLMYWNEKKQESCPYAWDEGHNGNVSSLSCTSKYELNEPSLITFTS
jgi:hypothetical protein